MRRLRQNLRSLFDPFYKPKPMDPSDALYGLDITVTIGKSICLTSSVRYTYVSMTKLQSRELVVYTSPCMNNKSKKQRPPGVLLTEYIPSLRRRERQKSFEYHTLQTYRVSRHKKSIEEGILRITTEISNVMTKYMPRSLMALRCNRKFKLSSFVSNIKLLQIDPQMGITESNIRNHYMGGQGFFIRDSWYI